MAKNADRIRQKYQNRVAGASGEYAAGVQDPKADWLQSYQKAAPKMEAETIRALNEKRHIKGAQAAGTQKWKDRAADQGAQRYASSAPQAAEGFAKALPDVLAAADAATKAASTLPDTTPEQREQRAIAAMRAISAYHRNKKGLTSK